MKSAVMKKTSQVLAVLMIVSMLLPVLAFAAVSFDKASYDKPNKTITGSVYSTVYNVNDNVYFAVYADSNATSVISSIYDATYRTVNGATYFDFTITLADSSVADSVYVKAFYGVSAAIYNAVYTPAGEPGAQPGEPGTEPGVPDAQPGEQPEDEEGRSAGGGGGGAAAEPGKVDASNGKVDASVLTQAFEGKTNVEVNISGDKAELPASALVDAAKKAGTSITIVSENGTYNLPLSVLNLDTLAKALGVDIKDLTITVTISEVSGDTAADVNSAIDALGGNAIADVIEFTVTASANGKSVNIDFGTTYASRSLNVSKAVNAATATGVLYNPVTKKLSFVPATFATKDGKTVATLKRNGNSIYTVIENNKSFEDLASHWAKADVELLANKLVVEGVSDNQFQPNRNITRAEFATLVVRSLGLTSGSSASQFSDVNAGAWYSGAVSAAVKAGIINGYEDNTFRPNTQITREELAAMVVRALNYAGVKTEISASKQAELLAKFNDANQIIWAQKEIAAAIHAGIINGLTDNTIGSASEATRAQSATMLKRFLGSAGFIN
ncbi:MULTISPECIES: S-layer homology domain-containing protein [unclassified Paenibacillus]|uniref:S-layer homology domain-containing protein n=1 Tax=unclassified Paenibacillus TaxID=185978 RepID=UPI001AEAB869|nr:hypothetical protein [Paenibacillus sp. PvP091]MBP1171785.1 hypothetical protein [Paenibacillus sp. PvR098]MBP2438166.1 hypothetical protein [Paenibacillus sp. PvP052]